jgi:hypothetical protein
MEKLELGMVVHACNPSYFEGRGRRIVQKHKTLSKNKGLGHGSRVEH